MLSFEYISWMKTRDRLPLSPRATSNIRMGRRAGRQKPVFWCMPDWPLPLYGAAPSWEQFGKVRCLPSSQLSGLAELSNLPLSGLGRAARQFARAVVTEQRLQMRCLAGGPRSTCIGVHCSLCFIKPCGTGGRRAVRGRLSLTGTVAMPLGKVFCLTSTGWYSWWSF